MGVQDGIGEAGALIPTESEERGVFGVGVFLFQ